MIALHGKCNMCGRLEAAIEVDLPHATDEHKKRFGISATTLMATAVCRECARAITAAWAQHGAAEWARTRAEWEAARAQNTDPAEAP